MKNSGLRFKRPMALPICRLATVGDSVVEPVYKEKYMYWSWGNTHKANASGTVLSAENITCVRAGPKVKKDSKVVNIPHWQLVGMNFFRPLSDLYLTSNGTMHRILSLTPSVNNFCMCL